MSGATRCASRRSRSGESLAPDAFARRSQGRAGKALRVLERGGGGTCSTHTARHAAHAPLPSVPAAAGTLGGAAHCLHAVRYTPGTCWARPTNQPLHWRAVFALQPSVHALTSTRSDPVLAWLPPHACSSCFAMCPPAPAPPPPAGTPTLSSESRIAGCVLPLLRGPHPRGCAVCAQ